MSLLPSTAWAQGPRPGPTEGEMGGVEGDQVASEPKTSLGCLHQPLREPSRSWKA